MTLKAPHSQCIRFKISEGQTYQADGLGGTEGRLKEVNKCVMYLKEEKYKTDFTMLWHREIHLRIYSLLQYFLGITFYL